ncbi:hypothetical protein Halru_0725 [Halovivax ruber XH-70]|uniref:Uncharacterized protein n=1 Tax=Halovivax ruber (strain DSM 18193 / JCM 13892 / XH-70) TaxID=797302 RepID=L0IBP7_HALRX|nr:hypothetical protein [Halovivax ruber]AGB15352.1 hypothetical protein Halru_0725 [Halovivax ruber XH-70]
MEWVVAIVIGLGGYAAAGIAGGLALTMERQPETVGPLFGAVRVIGLVIAGLAVVFATLLVGHGLLALV